MCRETKICYYICTGKTRSSCEATDCIARRDDFIVGELP